MSFDSEQAIFTLWFQSDKELLEVRDISNAFPSTINRVLSKALLMRFTSKQSLLHFDFTLYQLLPIGCIGCMERVLSGLGLCFERGMN